MAWAILGMSFVVVMSLLRIWKFRMGMGRDRYDRYDRRY